MADARPVQPAAGLTVRAVRLEDTRTLYDICLRTGAFGEDASALHDDPRLLGEVYVGPYLALAPDLAFVLADAAGLPVGYVLGAADTTTFEETCERVWWPPLRARYPVIPSEDSPDAGLVRLIHTPPRTPIDVVEHYPAHLHVDLLPEGQGSGNGRRLLETLFTALHARRVPGVHLGVSARNGKAIGFYEHLGFTTLSADEHGRRMGLLLT